MAPAGHACRQRPQRMQAPGFSALARPELLQLNTAAGHACRQRPQATQADSFTDTRVVVVVAPAEPLELLELPRPLLDEPAELLEPLPDALPADATPEPAPSLDEPPLPGCVPAAARSLALRPRPASTPTPAKAAAPATKRRRV